MPCTDGTDYPVFWGRSADDSLNAAQMLALTNTATKDEAAGDYEFEALSDSYLYVALPQSFGEVDTFVLEHMHVAFDVEEITLTVDVEGVPTNVDYYLYRSPELTSATDPVLTVEE